MRTPGHRELTPEETDRIEEIRQLGDKLEALVFALERDGTLRDQRWIAIAKTDLQKGLMSLIRGIIKPKFF